MSAKVAIGGFADLAAQVAGLGWRLNGERGGLLLAAGEVNQAEAEIEGEGNATRLKLTAGGTRCEAELHPRPGLAPLQTSDGESPAGAVESGRCAATIKLRGAGRERSLECAGHLSRWAQEPEGIELLRHLALPAAGESLLVLAAARPAGAGAHGEEDVSAWLIDPEGRISGFAESLLSTQYDGGGRSTRIGLELWPDGEEAPALRGAGTRLGGTAEAGGAVSATLLSSSVEGAKGIGSYLIWRR